MALKTLWYLNLADGDYPWIPGGLYPLDFDRYRRLAQTIDAGGFYGALVATWPNDPFVSASFAASYTTRMRFLVAVYARMTPAKLLAQQALTFDAFTGGRLLLNLINGRDNIMETYGVSTSHDDRYALGEAYWRDFRRFYAEGNPTNFPNTPLVLPPTQAGGPALWGAGDSDAGVAHAGAVIDVYLTMLRRLGPIRAKFDAVRAAAQRRGRTFADMGALASAVVRPSRAEAEAHFYDIFRRTGVETIVAKLDAAVVRRTGGRQNLATFVAPNEQRQGWVRALLAGRLPALEDLRLEGSLFAGITAWSPLDIFDAGSSAVYFVGDPDTIAADVARYHDDAGLTALILSGWPLIDEARRVSELLLPRLAEIA
ncbi:LLM class flavin-dependent oxidoreductase [Segnochrobactrum spirostomi]|uniref:LLM class flavin-dependent oxidoreductase n=1 Tax=Segnochrobactrum spirostomi TaxID=2608987 RepID=A0A6A7XXX0_9HYPH|nr:LLM class flavin-dependent oxidoreductase [Segnochrobactrum spirostomi]MQT11086.1 LLM class flavin-dependent oxidoreductase [Segnochrobactrum spirostomi]